MECLSGKRSFFLDRAALRQLVIPYQEIHLDLGTGDGRFVLRLARAQPTCFVVGVDACRENLQQVSRRAPSNALFVIANALSLPDELIGIATHLSILFPWGSLLAGLLDVDFGLLDGIRRVAAEHASLEVCLNAGALEEQGWKLELGTAQVRRQLAQAGFAVHRPDALHGGQLLDLPSTWAKRLAYGRDPQATILRATRAGTAAGHLAL